MKCLETKDQVQLANILEQPIEGFDEDLNEIE